MTTLVSSPSILLPLSKMEEVVMPHARSMRSSSSSLISLNLREIQEELHGVNVEEENKVYVAVSEEVQEWIENLRWLVNNIDKDRMIVFLHVHQPAQRIATLLGYMPANGVEQQELAAHRQLEKEQMNKCLKKYVDICAKKNFNAITLSTDNDNIVKGLLELIKQHKVTDLVMGGGSARNLFKFPNSRAKEKKPNSRIANSVREKAEPSCRICFINRGELICIREPHQIASDARNLSRSSSGSSSDHSVQLQFRSQSMPPSQAKQTDGPSGLDQKSRSVHVVAGASFPTGSPHPSYYSGFENPYGRSSSSRSSSHSLVSEVDSYYVTPDSFPATPLNDSPSPFHNVTIRTTENKLNTEMQKKSEFEDPFARQYTELERTKNMYEQSQNELVKVNELLSSLDLQNMRLRQTVASLETKFEETNALVEKITQERDVALRKAHEFAQHGSSSHNLENCTEFTYTEIKEATKNFDPAQKIGEGGFGAVYIGFLRHTTVAIKIQNRDSIHGDQQFYQEIEFLSRIRHPHLVMLIGACLEARALVYEYFALGSLDNHLPYKNHYRPLSWKARARVALEICSALIFLHSSGVVHADLKPENILLGSNFTVKLSDMGICRQVHMTNTTTTPFHVTDQPKGTLPYMDPEIFASGELTPQYDVFSFGIVLLQLVTGKEAKRLRNDMEDAIEKQIIEKIVDASAGWPPEQAKKMIQIGLWCSDASRRKRPDLVKDVWGWLESIANDASASMRRSLTKPTN